MCRVKFTGREHNNGFSKDMQRYIQIVKVMYLLGFLVINGAHFDSMMILVKAQLK